LEKLRAIQEKIENGTYQIDYEKTAENIMDAYLGEIT
jgi:anti-sigma28 factor (negative regulator of flagellin synthesis)